jgi:hypothetical protein
LAESRQLDARAACGTSRLGAAAHANGRRRDHKIDIDAVLR